MSNKCFGRYLPRFKVAALGLAEHIGIASAAKQLWLHESQMYAWRNKACYEAGRSESEVGKQPCCR